jgi:lipase maturation factor 1
VALEPPVTTDAPTAGAPSSALTIWVFVRALALVYLIAFLSLRVQILGLFGSQGILPVTELLTAVADRLGPERYWVLPTLAWLDAGDATLTRLCDVGAVLALVVVAGFAPGPCLLALWALYLSLVVVGRVFLSFQWDMLLLEAGLLAVLVAPWSLRPALATLRSPPWLGVWLLRWLLFRLMFASGVVKLLHDDPSLPTWHQLTALTYHFETQCLPPWTAWYAHHLPLWWQRFSCAVMFVVELAVPFLIFGPRVARLTAGVIFIAFQLLIVVTGNYTFFNWLTIALCLPLFDDRALRRVLPERLVGEGTAVPRPPGIARGLLATPLAVLLLVAGTAAFAQQMLGRSAVPAAGRQVLEWLAPVRSVNGYGLFARMTTVRNEIVIEGSRDGTTWTPYELTWKPGDVMRRPTFVAPHQPRLDWQMWFAALTPYRANPEQWFARLLARLLEGSPEVVALFAANPFPDEPPRHVRAVVYEYHFSEWGAAAGGWWRREPRGTYAPVLTRR